MMADTTASSDAAHPHALPSLDPIEQKRYSSLPPTVFAPTGRLHMIERVGLAAASIDDVAAGLVIALCCGEFTVLVVAGPKSPYMHLTRNVDTDHNEGHEQTKQQEDISGDDNYLSPLFVTESSYPLPPTTTAVLSPNLMVATGGNAADAAVLLDRVQSVASDLHNSNSGGTSFDFDGGHKKRSGMFGVTGADLARRMADLAQIPTQSVGTRTDGMLAASCLILDASPSCPLLWTEQAAESGNKCGIWKVDPSGQFWSCHAAAIGRGAGLAESLLLEELSEKVASDLDERDGEEDGGDKDSDGRQSSESMSSEEVKACLTSLSVDDAIEIACKCIARVYGGDAIGERPTVYTSEGDEGSFRSCVTEGRNLGAAILRPESDAIETMLISRLGLD